MFVFRKLTDPALRRLYKFIFKRLIGSFLRNDLDLEQLNIELRAGKFELNNLELNVDLINDYLLGSPFCLSHGFIRDLKAKISYKELLSDSCVIDVSGIDIVLAPACRRGKNKKVSQKPSSVPLHADDADIDDDLSSREV